MRIAIFTHPLRTNYGGNLQAFALQRAISNLGHEVYTINCSGNDAYRGLLHQFFAYTKRTIQHHILRKDVSTAWAPGIPDDDYNYISQYIRPFIQQQIKTTGQVSFRNLASCVEVQNLDAYVVGSDQVWASNSCPSAFLPFIKNKDKIKITYAASSGNTPWFNDWRTRKKCLRLIRHFKAISVREHALADALRTRFGIDANVHLDPTLLLYPEDYLSCINLHEIGQPALCSYLLDLNPAKESIEKHIATVLSLNVKRVNAKQKYSLTKQNDLDACTFPSIDEWLSTYYHCEYIITDSFHGTVFAIIFNKPFICLGNKERGSARFDTLLGTFGLKDRMISNTTQEKIDRILNTPIDWERVNSILEFERQRGINYLKENLKDK